MNTPDQPNQANQPDAAPTGAEITERGVIVEGQRIATAMNDGPRAFLSRAPLVILPDALYTWQDYRAILDRFAPGRRVFALDWPGFGASARPSPEEFAYTLDHLAAVFAQWMDNLGIARAAIMAHGAAAGVATRYAVAHPLRTLGLALVGPIGFAPRGALESLAGRALSSPALLRLAEPTLTALALGPTTEATEAIETARRQRRKEPGYAVTLAATLALWHDVDANRATAATQAKAVRSPALVIRGGLDPLCAAPEAQAASESLGEHGGLGVTLPEAGHLPHLQQPDRFYQALEGLVTTAETGMFAAN